MADNSKAGDRGRTGVFICRCGGNISGTVDVKTLKDTLVREMPEIAHICDDEHLCSSEGQRKIAESIRRHSLDRIVIGSCSPILHEKTFMRCLERSGLNQYMLDIANIREHCSWVAEDPGKATDKACILLRASIARVGRSKPLSPVETSKNESVVIVGGGVAGITAALSLARQGITTHLVEKRESVGGNMVRAGKVFSPDKLAEECALCALSPMMNDLSESPNIRLHTLSEVREISGCAGNFTVKIEKKPHYVNPGKCSGCGTCSSVCPVEVSDWWNAGLKKRKAIFRPFPQAVPATYTIDTEACSGCGECAKACRLGAIDLEGKPEIVKVTAGAIIIATGHGEYDASKKSEYGYGRFKDVITQTELSRITAVNGPTLGRLLRPSDGKPPKRVVMLQCVGSRDEKPDGNKYCSKVCCMVAIKHANHIKSFSPFTDVIICYMDIRTGGSYEHYYRHSQENGVRFLRGKPADVIQKDGLLVVRVEDTLSREILDLETDLLVLSEGMVPSRGTSDIADVLNVSRNGDGFIREKHPKLQPVDTDAEGVFACGTALGPKDITESVIQANAASARALELLRGRIVIEPKMVEISADKCDGCGKCIALCRFKALYVNGKGVLVDRLACAGCGACVVACSRGAISQPFCSDEQLQAVISALLFGKKPGERRILAFLDEKVAYVSADNAGTNKLSYGDDVYIVRVPSTNRLGLSHVLYALRSGADGVFLGEGPENGPLGKMFSCIQDRFAEMRLGLKSCGIDPRRLSFSKIYTPHFRGLKEKLALFKRELQSVPA